MNIKIMRKAIMKGSKPLLDWNSILYCLNIACMIACIAIQYAWGEINDMLLFAIQLR